MVSSPVNTTEVVRCPACFLTQISSTGRCKACRTPLSLAASFAQSQTTLPMDVAAIVNAGGSLPVSMPLLRFSDAYAEVMRIKKAMKAKHWSIRSAWVDAHLSGDDKHHRFDFKYLPKETTHPSLDKVVCEMVRYAPELLAWPWMIEDPT